MIERITELLTRNNIPSKELVLITVGTGGAYVYSADDKYVVKYAYQPDLDYEVCKQCRNEFYFYEICTKKNLDFIPEIIFQTANDNEILLVMQKYTPIKVEEWDESLQKSAMELCARINATDTTDFISIVQSRENETGEKIINVGQDEKPYPLSLSYQNWVNLFVKFPGYIDAVLLEEMYKNFNNICSYGNKQFIPETLCHGDCHPQNFLKNGNKLIVCDWQGVNIGKGIGDVAFFISRGADMDLKIDRNKLISDYTEALYKYANIHVNVSDFHNTVAVDEFSVSFRFWAQYLQDSNINRVLNIYNTMVKNYKLILNIAGVTL